MNTGSRLHAGILSHTLIDTYHSLLFPSLLSMLFVVVWRCLLQLIPHTVRVSHLFIFMSTICLSQSMNSFTIFCPIYCWDTFDLKQSNHIERSTMCACISNHPNTIYIERRVKQQI
eukprot:144801_1